MTGSTPRRTVLVGIDGSTNSSRALDWAVTEAARRGLDLIIAHVVDTTAAVVPSMGYAVTLDDDTERGAALMEAAVDRATRVDPQVRVRTHLFAGDPAQTLLDAALDADLVVVGSRGLGPLGSALFGSVSDRLTSRAPVPVAVIPGDGSLPVAEPQATAGVSPEGEDGAPGDEPAQDTRVGGLVRVHEEPPALRDHVVVGVDGSPQADAALRFALDEAASRGTTLLVVSAWRIPPGPAWIDRIEDEVAYQRDARPAAHKAALVCVEDALLRTRAPSHRGVPVEICTAEGDAGRVILEASKDAALTVVGSRNRGPVRGMLLGSVSREVLRRANGPVVIVHGTKGKG